MYTEFLHSLSLLSNKDRLTDKQTDRKCGPSVVIYLMPVRLPNSKIYKWEG